MQSKQYCFHIRRNDNRFSLVISGAQEFYNINPDISTFGKAMANGYSVSAVVGKKKFMKLGSIEEKGKKDYFFCLAHMELKCRL